MVHMQWCKLTITLCISYSAIEDTVGYVVAVVTNTSRVIAASRDNSSYLLSEDDGVTWEALTDDELAQLQALPG